MAAREASAADEKRQLLTDAIASLDAAIEAPSAWFTSPYRPEQALAHDSRMLALSDMA